MRRRPRRDASKIGMNNLHERRHRASWKSAVGPSGMNLMGGFLRFGIGELGEENGGFVRYS